MKMSLEIILGSMYSGKSTTLIKKTEGFQKIGKRCLLVNHVLDSRVSGNYVRSHDDITLEAIKTDDLATLDVKNFDVILIDEGQFFTNMKREVEKMLEQKLTVIVAGLNSDYNMKKFGEMINLVPIADNIIYLQSNNCYNCGENASFTKRLSSEEEVVSVNSSYAPSCRKCHSIP
jgi:thymidine kinase